MIEERRELARQAIESYTVSLQLNPYQSPVLLDRGKMHEILGEYELAQKNYEKAIEVYPTDPKGYFLLGYFFRDRGDTQRAKQAFENAQKFAWTGPAWVNLEELKTRPR